MHVVSASMVFVTQRMARDPVAEDRGEGERCGEKNKESLG